MARAASANTATVSTNGSPTQLFSEQSTRVGLFNSPQAKHSIQRGVDIQSNFLANEIMSLNRNRTNAGSNEAQDHVFSQHQLSSFLCSCHHTTKSSCPANVQKNFIPNQIMNSSSITRARMVANGNSSSNLQVDEGAAERRLSLAMFCPGIRETSSKNSSCPKTISNSSLAPPASNTSIDCLMPRNDRVTGWVVGHDMNHMLFADDDLESIAQVVPARPASTTLSMAERLHRTMFSNLS
jgi:hypothetical protein